MRAWIFALLCFSAFANADEQAWALNYGQGINDTLIQSGDTSSADLWGLEYYHELPMWQLLSSDKVFFNAHYQRIESDLRVEHDALDIVAASVNWHWRSASYFFGEAGIGLAYESDTQFLNIRTGQKLNFVLDFGVGYLLNQSTSVSLRYRHYSNGYTQSPNPGLDFIVAQARWAF